MRPYFTTTYETGRLFESDPVHFNPVNVLKEHSHYRIRIIIFD